MTRFWIIILIFSLSNPSTVQSFIEKGHVKNNQNIEK